MAAVARFNRVWRGNTISSRASTSCTSLLSPLYSSMVVRHGPCLLLWGKDPGFRDQVPEEVSPYLLHGAQDQRLGAEEDQPPFERTRTSCRKLSRDGNLHGSGMSRATTASPKPSSKAPNVRGVGDAEKMLDEHQGVDIPCSCRNCSQRLQQKRLEEDRCWIVTYVHATTHSVEGLKLTECICPFPPREVPFQCYCRYTELRHITI